MTDRLEQLEKLFEADDQDPFITYGIALEHSKQANYDQAIEWLDRTLSIDSKYCYAYYQKAKAQSEMGDVDTARQTIRDGISAATSSGDEHAREELMTLLDTLG